MRRQTPILAALMAGAMAHGAAGGQAEETSGGDVEWGAYLASECTTCHSRGGSADGIPSITGLPEAGFAAALRAYRAGERSNQSMQTVARGLDDDDIAALAAYFATYPPAGD